MKKHKQYVQQVKIEQVENGYYLEVGLNCNSAPEVNVFQTMAELTKFLEDHFKYRQDDIEIDSYSSSNN